MTTSVVRRERIVALDIMRGFFMTVIIADHLHFFPGLFELLGGRGELWVSAAEGFFMISGLLVGYIYAPKMAANLGAAFKKIWRRAGLLYVWSVILTTIALFWAQHVHGPIKEGLWQHPPLLEFLYKTLTLQYSYGWADFLQYYVLFMIFAPFAVWLCLKRKAWIVIAASLGVYLFRGQNFNMAWQLMFMGGLVIGYYLPTIEAWVRSLSKQTKRTATTALVVASVSTIVVSAAIVHGGMIIDAVAHMHPAGWWAHFRDNLNNWNHLTAPYTTKWTLEPARVALSLLWFTTLYVAIRPREAWVNKKTFGFLRTIGEASLLVYGAHALVIMGVHLYIPANLGYLGNTLVTAVFLGMFYCLARYYKVIKFWPGALFQKIKRYNKKLLWNQQ